MKMELVISGRPISKKNHMQFRIAGGRRFITTSTAYKKFERNALFQLMAIKKKLFTKPVSVTYQFYIQGKYHVDFDNLIAGINDILQKANILVDDDLIVKGSFEKIGGCAGWSTKLSIEEV